MLSQWHHVATSSNDAGEDFCISDDTCTALNFDISSQFSDNIESSASSLQYLNVIEHVYAKLLRKRKYRKKAKKYSCLKLLVWMPIMLSVISIGTSGYISWIYRTEDFKHCVTCIGFKRTVLDGKVQIRHRYGKQYCCVNNQDDVIHLLNTIIKHNKPISNRRKNAVVSKTKLNVIKHMEIGRIASANKHRGVDGRTNTRLLIENSSRSSAPKTDRVVVEKAGRYLVISQFTYHFKLTEHSKTDNLRIYGHTVKRYNHRLPNDEIQSLLVGFVTICSSCTDIASQFEISYLSGIFNLAANDELFVTVSEDDDHARTHRSYFALIQLSI